MTVRSSLTPLLLIEKLNGSWLIVSFYFARKFSIRIVITMMASHLALLSKAKFRITFNFHPTIPRVSRFAVVIISLLTCSEFKSYIRKRLRMRIFYNDQAHLDNFVYLHGGDILACKHASPLKWRAVEV